ncbi:phage tail protein [Dyella flagellata]|uniref:Microcystin dependent protein n=1 Tax=Dyella flagellata TaxID=1867833 RepID=A0ABQ5X4B9_9GAMM|nr:tail fiber protein [Dyella flagellata]GLQ86467.1 microcystin dependent protein [Dyella flagellata]
MSVPFVGEIRLFGFSRVPTGWLPCDGSVLPISNFEVLFALIGTTYGGNGTTAFAVPDLRGSVPLHQGTGLGLSPHPLGQVGGTEGVTLLSGEMPQHTHIANATTTTANANTPANTLVPGTLGGTDTMYSADLTGATAFTMAANAVGFTGGNLPHDNTMPTLTVQYCIAYNGIFPSQS